MGYINTIFLGKEYSIPQDVLSYIELLEFTDNVQKQLASTFVRKLRNELDQGNVGCLDNEIMAPDIEQQVGKFIAKLTDRGIYDRTINDYLRKNEGYKLISKVNTAALDEAKRALRQQIDDWLEGYEDALHKKDASVTGLGFSIWSSSFVNHAIYAAMEVSKVKEQERAAVKEYQKDMAELDARLESRKSQEEKQYITNVYIPHMETAITVFSYELLDTFISDLIQYGKLSKDVLNYIHIDRSNDLLKNLELSQNKEAVLLKAFEACPYNVAVYMQAMKYDLLDYESFQTAKLFKHGSTIISFLEENLGGAPNSEKKRLNFKNAELLSLYSGRALREITSYMADSIVDGYAQTVAALSNIAPCHSIMNKVEERDILAGDNISKQKADWLVDPLAPAILWDKLTSEYGHTDLFDRLLILMPDRPAINSKQEYDAFLKNKLFAILESIRQERVEKIHEQQQKEAKKKEEEAENARRAAKRNKKIKIISSIAVAIAIIIAIISSVITKANNAKAYQEMAGEFCVYRVINDDGEERDEFNWWLSVEEDGTVKLTSWSYAIDNCEVDSYSGSLKNKADFRKFEDYRIEDYCADGSEYEEAEYCYEFHIADEWDEFEGYIVCWQYQNGKIVDVYCDDYRYSFVETGDDYSFSNWEKEIDSDGLSGNVKIILDNIINLSDENSRHEEESVLYTIEYNRELTWHNIELASSFLGEELNADGSLSMSPEDCEAMSNDMYLFDIPGRFYHGWSSVDADPIIVDILGWVTTKSVGDFNKILYPLIERYGDDYRVQYYNDAAGDAYVWKKIERYEYVICWQNAEGIVEIRWTVNTKTDDTAANTKKQYADAVALIDEGDYVAAYNILAKLSSYPDAVNMLKNFKWVPTESTYVTAKDSETNSYHTYTYNDNSFLIEEVINDSTVVTYSYDSHGNLILKKYTYSDGGTSQYEYKYNASNQLIQERYTYPDGSVDVVNYTYDSNGRISEAEDIHWGNFNERLTYSYDSTGKLIRKDTIDHFDSLGCYEYQYDEHGHLIKEIHTTDIGESYSVVYTTEYSYSADGHLIEIYEYEDDRETGYEVFGEYIVFYSPDGFAD